MPTHRSVKLTIISAVVGAFALAAMPATGGAAVRRRHAIQIRGDERYRAGALARPSWRRRSRDRRHRRRHVARRHHRLVAILSYYYGRPGTITARRRYYPPPSTTDHAYGPDGWEAYCSSRYRSFDPRTGTYMGYDGIRHPCR